MANLRLLLPLTAALLTFGAMQGGAKVTRISIEQRHAPASFGKQHGKAGQYEILKGHFTGELDPADPHNTIINDIALAPRNARGMVEYTGTFALSKPVDMAKASSVMIYTVPNRGRGAPVASDAGHVSVVSGWQGDLTAAADMQTITVPAARNADGSPITGPITAVFIDTPPGAHTMPLSKAVSAISYQLPVSLDPKKATLTKRASLDAARVPIASMDWAFADCTASNFPGKPDRAMVCVKEGFDPGLLYELVYEAKDPLVLGIGYAATRDFNSFLRYEAKDSAGNANPVAGKIRFAVAEGNSQSGNFIRSYLHLGFNQDERNRIVYDGVNPHIAARQLAMNYRFAVAGGTSKLYEPGSDAVLWWSPYPDVARHGKKAGLLDRCTATKTCPKIVETFGGLEFWGLRMSPDLVGTDAKEDIPLPANVRRYYFPATSHGGGRGGFDAEPAAAPGGCQLAANPNPEAETLRALRAALVEWVRRGVEPPASRYPKLHPDASKGEEGQLAPPTRTAMGFPAIPGVPSPEGVINPVYDYDFGPGFNYADLSGRIDKAPPVIRGTIPMLVPKTDADGNDLGGVPSLLRQVPLGTYTGWNVTVSGFNRNQYCGLSGGFIPFARTKAERMAKGDPRLSLEERYGTHAKYVELVKAAAARAVSERFLLSEDAERLVAQAEASRVLAGW